MMMNIDLGLFGTISRGHSLPLCCRAFVMSRRHGTDETLLLPCASEHGGPDVKERAEEPIRVLSKAEQRKLRQVEQKRARREGLTQVWYVVLVP